MYPVNYEANIVENYDKLIEKIKSQEYDYLYLVNIDENS